ncbi:diguanylate cyclase [Vibrio sp. SCSIO 43136]|uniref:sensor domain-containing diguanylate cyclase n=1 Tax=Vibrio sp. SCSIO 43136 TaxID=2819101 RepID=UPI0020761FEC|nr:diguanylate cyclase [Vibrio sp. SCSIO 43136]USD66947.1 diguanylate cyclase [Vibrio sp. SCSIO 43136]
MITSLLFGVTLKSEQQVVDDKQHKISKATAEKAQHFLDISSRVLSSYAGLFYSQQAITREEFSEFSQILLAKNSTIEAIQWAPVIKAENRSELEQELQQSGFAHQGFVAVDKGALSVTPAEEQSFHVPILFSEPVKLHGSVIGLDLNQRSGSIEAMDYASRYGEIATSALFTPIQAKDHSEYIALYYPIYHGKALQEINSQVSFPPANLRGFVVALINPNDIINRVLPLPDATISLVDVANTPEHALAASELPQGVYRFDLHLGNRQFALHLNLPEPKVAAWTPTLVLVAFGLLTLVVVSAIAISFRQTAMVTRANSKLEIQKQELHQLAMTDALTGLPNRLLLKHKATQAMERSTFGYAVGLIDLDNFKFINDIYGHQTGDLFLRQIARALDKELNKIGFVARLGGDEFVFVIEQIGCEAQLEEVLRPLMERLRGVCREVCPEQSESCVTASIGVVMSQHPSGFEGMLQKADEAMYQAKNLGKNGYVIRDISAEKENPTSREVG